MFEIDYDSYESALNDAQNAIQLLKEEAENVREQMQNYIYGLDNVIESCETLELDI